MKKILAISVALLSIIPIQAHAQTLYTNIAIIDTGYDPSIPLFAGKIVAEACYSSDLPSCPNKQYQQFGSGSAALNAQQLSIPIMAHGTQMLSDSIAINPNTKFVFIRDYSTSGTNASAPTTKDFISILNWIYNNESTLNVGAIAFSAAQPWTTSCPSNSLIQALANNFQSIGVPIISAAGNEGNYTHVDFPACIKPIIAVGSVDNYSYSSGNVHSLYSNAGAGLDFDAYGNFMKTINVGNTTIQSVGTSVAVQVFAADWIAIKQAKPSLSYAQEYALIQATQTLSGNQYVKGIPTINLAGALK